MNSWLQSLFTGDLLTGDISLGHEGLPWGWGFMLFLLLASASTWAYLRCAPGISPARRRFLTILRTISLALVVLLLIRPVALMTIREPVRHNLLVLIDASDSMNLADKRRQPADLRRAAIAAGLLPPDAGINGPVPADAPSLASLTRWQLLQKLNANPRLELWSRILERADILPFTFGRDAVPLTPITGTDQFDREQIAALFSQIKPTAPTTAIGESLRQALEQASSQSLSGILLITDGANNSGIPPTEAALLARDQNLPLWIYGIGVSRPTDIAVRDFSVPRLAYVKERLTVTVRVHAQDLTGRTVPVSLKVNGTTVDEQPLAILRDGDTEITLGFVPQEIGTIELTVSIPSQEGEASTTNNSATAKVRVVNTRTKVLLIERQPRWDFRYLLDYLTRDRRLDVRATMILGEPGLELSKDSPFLPKIPESRADLLSYEIIILGDVSPQDLGQTRMELIREWVEKLNGGLIFHAGTDFNPAAYIGTPLEVLLPIIPAEPSPPDRALEPFPLQITTVGHASGYLKLDDNPAEDRRIWEEFKGVRWTARSLRGKSGARILAVDPSPERATRDGPMPVIATQKYGSGQVFYIGTDETYRLRSRQGEKYYSRFWGQIIQAISLERIEGASSLAQLRASKPVYFVGDKVVISGKMFKSGFEPRTDALIPARLTIRPSPRGPDSTESLSLIQASDQPGHYRTEFIARVPGSHSFSPADDPASAVRFEVVEPQVERLETSMNESLLQAMAEASGGSFFREENLHLFPRLLSEKRATVDTYQEVRLFHSPWWMAALLILALLEWTLRRLWQLK